MGTNTPVHPGTLGVSNVTFTDGVAGAIPTGFTFCKAETFNLTATTGSITGQTSVQVNPNSTDTLKWQSVT